MQPTPVKKIEAPKTARGIKTRAKILKAAEQVFGNKGFHAASISEITQVAEVSQGTFYIYFPDKEEAFRALVEFMGQETQAFIRQRTGAARRQQEIDGGAGAPGRMGRRIGRVKDLSIVAALGMRLEPEMGDDLVGGHWVWRQSPAPSGRGAAALCHAGGGTVDLIEGILEAELNHLASLGCLLRQSRLPKRKSR